MLAAQTKEHPMYLVVEIYHDRVKLDKQYIFRPDHIAPSQWIRLWEAAANAIRAATHDR